MNLKRALSYLFVVLVFGFLFWNIAKSWQQLTSVEFTFKAENTLPILFSLILLYPINSTAWHFVTKSLGLKINLSANIRLWMLSNSARFLPGGFWQYASRIYLGKESGFGTGLAATAVLIESLLTLGVGSLIVLLVFAFWSLPANLAFPSYLLITLISLPILLSALTRPKVMRLVLQTLSRFSKKKVSISKVNLPPRWVLPLALIFFLEFFLPGTILFFLTRSFIELSLSLYPLFIGVFAASFLAGYIVFFAPSGLGIQEASIAGLLSIFMAFPLAAAIAIIFRFILLLSEVWFLLAVLVFTRKVQLKYN